MSVGVLILAPTFTFTFTLTCLAPAKTTGPWTGTFEFLLHCQPCHQCFNNVPCLRLHLTRWPHQYRPLTTMHGCWSRSLVPTHPQNHLCESETSKPMDPLLTVLAMSTIPSLPSQWDPMTPRKSSRSIGDYCVTSQAISIAC